MKITLGKILYEVVRFSKDEINDVEITMEIESILKQYRSELCQRQRENCAEELRIWDTEERPNVSIPFYRILNAEEP